MGPDETLPCPPHCSCPLAGVSVALGTWKTHRKRLGLKLKATKGQTSEEWAGLGWEGQQSGERQQRNPRGNFRGRALRDDSGEEGTGKQAARGAGAWSAL